MNTPTTVPKTLKPAVSEEAMATRRSAAPGAASRDPALATPIYIGVSHVSTDGTISTVENVRGVLHAAEGTVCIYPDADKSYLESLISIADKISVLSNTDISDNKLSEDGHSEHEEVAALLRATLVRIIRDRCHGSNHSHAGTLSSVSGARVVRLVDARARECPNSHT